MILTPQSAGGPGPGAAGPGGRHQCPSESCWRSWGRGRSVMAGWDAETFSIPVTAASQPATLLPLNSARGCLATAYYPQGSWVSLSGGPAFVGEEWQPLRASSSSEETAAGSKELGSPRAPRLKPPDACGSPPLAPRGPHTHSRSPRLQLLLSALHSCSRCLACKSQCASLERSGEVQRSCLGRPGPAPSPQPWQAEWGSQRGGLGLEHRGGSTTSHEKEP